MLQTVANGLETAEASALEIQEENNVAAVKKMERRWSAFPLLPDPESRETRPVLAVFCYEDPDSVVGRFVTNASSALARRGVAVHLFARQDFDRVTANVVTHVLGETEKGELCARVEEFTGRACNAFLQLFQGLSAGITLLGFEWSAIPVVSLLRGIKNLDILLSLHSMERQRSDMTSELSRQIDKIELSGLREAKTVLVHTPAAAETARSAVPECAERLVPVREMFAVEPFAEPLDAGVVKARYHIGPLDPTILFVGDLEERYGPELLVKAMPAILKNHPQARLAIVGDGSLYWPLRVYTRYLLLEHAVRLVGHVEGQALNELIQAADIIAVPSREPTPWWPIQAAWAARRPLVASHQAAPGLLKHQSDAVLVYPSENSCVWGIERILFDAGLRQSLVDHGSDQFDERFGWGSVADQIQALITVPLAA
jgi:glycogen(starch) synthase